MTPKQSATRGRKHLRTIREAAHKLAHEFADLDQYIVGRGDEVIALADSIEDDIKYFLEPKE